jgi:hypothetical protein
MSLSTSRQQPGFTRKETQGRPKNKPFRLALNKSCWRSFAISGQFELSTCNFDVRIVHCVQFQISQ